MKLKELSRLLDLSATTVSRALNGYPEVNAETRARVLAAARRHGYVPNQMARRLATGRAMAIGHVVPLARHQIINPIFAEFMHGAGEFYSAAGYDMVLSIVPEREEAEAYAALARHHKVDGVIVHGPLRRDPRIDLLDAARPAVPDPRPRRPARARPIPGSTSTTGAPSGARPSFCSTSATGGSRWSTGSRRRASPGAGAAATRRRWRRAASRPIPR